MDPVSGNAVLNGIPVQLHRRRSAGRGRRLIPVAERRRADRATGAGGDAASTRASAGRR